MKICINGHGHMIYRTRKPMILKLGFNHREMELYKVYINHDPGMTLPYLPMHFNGQNKCKFI